eukprot:4841777-Amphidinium_carterae.1
MCVLGHKGSKGRERLMDKAPPPEAGDSGFKSHTGAFWHKIQFCNLEGCWKTLLGGLDCGRNRQF